MKAVVIAKFGGPENIALQDVADPGDPGDGEILVRVRAAGVNRADLVQLKGGYPPPQGYSPMRPGLEFAGEVAAVGPDIDDLEPRDRVFGITAGEAQAEYVRVDRRLATRIPEDLSFADAAAVPEVFVTAHDAIVSQGGLIEGETLLIHAVGSGVGLAALQIAKSLGAIVVGTSRTPAKLGRCREFGLDHAIETGTDPDFAARLLEVTAGNGADLILDLVGAAYLAENLACAAAKARIILVGLTSGSKAEFDLGVALRKRLTIRGTMLRGRSVDEKAEAMAGFESDIVPRLAAGKIHPTVDRIFAADSVGEAYKYLASNESFGKVVLDL